MNPSAALLGRILLGLIFVVSGISKIGNTAGTQAYMEAYRIPAAPLFLYAAMAIELIGGMMVILGYKSRVGSLLLAAFLIPTTLIFHTQFEDKLQMVEFLKNLSILGGLLFLFGSGPGKYSLSKD